MRYGFVGLFGYMPFEYNFGLDECMAFNALQYAMC